MTNSAIGLAWYKRNFEFVYECMTNSAIGLAWYKRNFEFVYECT